MINTKAAGQGFKLYSLCVGNYLIWFVFTSKQGGIDGHRPIKGLTSSAAVVLNLMEQLSGISRYVVYLDNFFTSDKLLLALRQRLIGGCGTCKRGCGITPELLVLRELFKKQHDWGEKAFSTINDGQILCMAWQDNNTVLLMTTAHSLEEAKEQSPKDPKKRHCIPDKSFEWADEEKHLMFPRPVIDYNKHMGGSDGNAQQRACGSPLHRDLRYWWPLFLFLLESSVLNAFILYQMGNPSSKCTHREFQRQIALSLLRNPAGQTKIRSIPSDLVRKRKYEGPDHEWEHLPKRKQCTVCTGLGIKRSPLQPIGANCGKRQRPPQTSWGCKHAECIKKAICKPGCWEKAHNDGVFT